VIVEGVQKVRPRMTAGVSGAKSAARPATGLAIAPVRHASLPGSVEAIRFELERMRGYL
jgi:hypothetical protein